MSTEPEQIKEPPSEKAAKAKAAFEKAEAEAKEKLAAPFKKDGSKPKKAQGLNDEEKKFIKENALKPGMTDAQIGIILGRHELTVAKYRKELGINKTDHIHKKKNDEDFKTKLGAASNLDDKRELFRNQLLGSARINRISQMFKETDLRYFVDRWVEYHLQFKDMTATEEDLLEKMVVLDIRLNYNQKFLYDLHEMTDKMKEKLSTDELNPENESDMVIIQTIQTYNGQEVELNKQYQLLLKEYQAIQQSLNATREQREQNQKIGALTFLDIIRQMNSDETKMKMGRTTELTKIAAERKRDQLVKPHKFIDGTVDIPILTAETFKNATQDKKSE